MNPLHYKLAALLSLKTTASKNIFTTQIKDVRSNFIKQQLLQ